MKNYSRPDWSPEKSEVTTRPNLIYPNGILIFYDGFESPIIKWDTGGIGTEWVNLYTLYPNNGSGHVLLSTGGTANNSAFIKRTIGLPQTKKMGFQFAFSPIQNNSSIIEVMIEWFSGTVKTTGAIRVYAINNLIEYYNSDGAWTTLSTTGPAFDANAFKYFVEKMIVDFSTGYYKSFNVSDKEYSLSSLQMRSVASGASEKVVLTITAITTSAASTAMAIDDVAATEE